MTEFFFPFFQCSLGNLKPVFIDIASIVGNVVSLLM